MGQATPNNISSMVQHRRRRVASLRLRGLSLYEIVDALSYGAGMIVNPETQQPYTKSTIDRDLDALEAQWRAEAVADIAAHKARQLAELKEARRRAWANGDVGEVRQNIALEMKLLGTGEPEKLQHGGETVLRVVYGDDGTDDPAA